MGILAFRKVRDHGGWMSNMSPHPIVFEPAAGVRVECRTSEHLFQALRLSRDASGEEAAVVLAEPSPLAAKWKARAMLAAGYGVVKPWSPEDVENMRLCVALKHAQHYTIRRDLAATDHAVLVEDTSSRPRPDLFWGARLGAVGEEHPLARYPSGVPGQWWIGENKLGEIWMEQRQAGRLL